MSDFVGGVEVIYLVMAVDKHTKKCWVLNSLYDEDLALKYLELVPKIYPEFNHFFVQQYFKNRIIAEIKPH